MENKMNKQTKPRLIGVETQRLLSGTPLVRDFREVLNFCKENSWKPLEEALSDLDEQLEGVLKKLEGLDSSLSYEEMYMATVTCVAKDSDNQDRKYCRSFLKTYEMAARNQGSTKPSQFVYEKMGLIVKSFPHQDSGTKVKHTAGIDFSK